MKTSRSNIGKGCSGVFLSYELLKKRYSDAVLKSFEAAAYDGKTALKTLELRYNHNHDSKGRFCSGGGSGSVGAKLKKSSNGLTNGKNNVRLDSNGVPFKYPTVNLPKREYSNVVSEIGRWWHTKYQGKEFCQLDFTNKTYYFENRGIGDYNIYRVKKG